MAAGPGASMRCCDRAIPHVDSTSCHGRPGPLGAAAAASASHVVCWRDVDRPPRRLDRDRDRSRQRHRAGDRDGLCTRGRACRLRRHPGGKSGGHRGANPCRRRGGARDRGGRERAQPGRDDAHTCAGTIRRRGHAGIGSGHLGERFLPRRHRRGLGPCARGQPQGPLPLRPGGGPPHGRARPRCDHQRPPRSSRAWPQPHCAPLSRLEGRGQDAHPGDGGRPRAVGGARERPRPGSHQHQPLPPRHRGGPPLHGGNRAAHPHGPPGGARGDGRRCPSTSPPEKRATSPAPPWSWTAATLAI